jgi:hypothetical protein
MYYLQHELFKLKVLIFLIHQRKYDNFFFFFSKMRYFDYFPFWLNYLLTLLIPNNMLTGKIKLIDDWVAVVPLGLRQLELLDNFYRWKSSCNSIVYIRRSCQNMVDNGKQALSVCFQPTCGYNRVDVHLIAALFWRHTLVRFGNHICRLF